MKYRDIMVKYSRDTIIRVPANLETDQEIWNYIEEQGLPTFGTEISELILLSEYEENDEATENKR